MKKTATTKAQLLLQIEELRRQNDALRAAAAGPAEHPASEKPLQSIYECLLHLGKDSLENINQLTALFGELLQADCALYNCLERGMLCTLGKWQTPDDLNPADRPEGHLCYDVIRANTGRPLIVRNLPDSPYAASDPNVRRYGLLTYIGHVVQCGGSPRGSLCAVYQRDYAPAQSDLAIAGIIATAIGCEEERRRVFASLQESEEKFRGIVHQSHDGIFLFDGRGIITEWNHGAERMTLLKPEQVIGHPVWDIEYRFFPDEKKSPAAYAAFKSSFLQFLNTGNNPFENRLIEVVLQLPDGSRRVIEDIMFSLKTRAGFMWCVIARDITDRKRIEEELLKAKKIEATGILASGVAHDFNNLLSIILGAVELAGDTLDTKDAAASFLQDAVKACMQARNLTKKFITFAAVGTAPRVAVQISGLLRDTARMVLAGSSSSPTYALPDDLWLCEIDYDQIMQAAMSILENAKEAMPHGGTVHIAAENVSLDGSTAGSCNGLPPGRYVNIAIQDQGIGIAPEDLPRIFDLYFSKKTRGIQKGMGLSLSIVYAIIKKHGGHIRVESPPGRGTRIEILLPAVTTEAAD